MCSCLASLSYIFKLFIKCNIKSNILKEAFYSTQESSDSDYQLTVLWSLNKSQQIVYILSILPL